MTRRAIPFVPVLRGRSLAEQAAEQLNALIEDKETSGWSFVQLDVIVSYEPAGCLAGNFGAKNQVDNVQGAVFERNARRPAAPPQ